MLLLQHTLSLVENMIKNKGNNPSLQIFRIVSKFPDLVESHSFKQPLFVNLRIKPTEQSRTYLAQIKLTGSKKLDVLVLKPNLAKENKENKNVPHMYSLKDGRICLYLPKEIDSSDDYSIVVPWISEWLYHYEVWKITGKWCGGGHSFKRRANE